MNQTDALKKQVAEAAVDHIRSGMRLGLGTGSTMLFALQAISSRLRSGELSDIVGVPTSLQTEKIAGELRIPLSDLKETPTLDLAIDGADEVDPSLNLIKGGGGALLREKVVAQASKRFIVIVDEQKLSPQLGTRWAVPIEVMPFAEGHVVHRLQGLGAKSRLRADNQGQNWLTDQNNLIIDAEFGAIEHPETLAIAIGNIAGVMEHGLFVGMTSLVLCAGASGVRQIENRE